MHACKNLYEALTFITKMRHCIGEWVYRVVQGALDDGIGTLCGLACTAHRVLPKPHC